MFERALVIGVYLAMDEFMGTYEDGGDELLSEVIFIRDSRQQICAEHSKSSIRIDISTSKIQC